MIVFSDLHLRDKSANTVFGQVFPGLIEAVERYSATRMLVCLGDFYHVRYKIDVYLQNEVVKFFNILKNIGIQVILLPGNHDQINEQGENALAVFDELSNVAVINTPVINDYGHWVPYRKNINEILDFLKYCYRNPNKISSKKIIYMHHGIQGAKMNSSLVDDSGIGVNYFRNWMVLSGHYHMRQQIGDNIFYIGSPYQVDAGEAGQVKGFCRLDLVKGKLRYYDTVWGERYFNTLSNEVSKGDVVKIKAPEGVNLEEYRKSLAIPEGVHCIIEPTIAQTSRLSVSSNATFLDYVVGYVHGHKGVLDTQELLNLFGEIHANS